VKELQYGDGLVEGLHTYHARNQMQLVAVHGLEARHIRRWPEKCSEVLASLHVVMAGDVIPCHPTAALHMTAEQPVQRGACEAICEM
jgi:hypothetical protein